MIKRNCLVFGSMDSSGSFGSSDNMTFFYKGMSKHTQDWWYFNHERVKEPIGTEHKNEKNSASWSMVSKCLWDWPWFSVDGTFYVNIATNREIYGELNDHITIVTNITCTLKSCYSKNAYYLNTLIKYINTEIYELLRHYNLTLDVKTVNCTRVCFFIPL